MSDEIHHYEPEPGTLPPVNRTRTYPKIGIFYTVITGDTLTKISRWAYGTADRVSLLSDANNSLLKNRKLSGGIPTVYKNDKIWIPPIDDPPKEEIVYNETYDDTVTIKLNDRVFYGFSANSIERSLNSVVDGFSFSAPFNPLDDESYYLDPYSYNRADLYIGGKLYISGVVEGWAPDYQASSTITAITVRSRPGVLVDCPPTDNQLSYNGLTLRRICEKLLTPYGITVEYPYGDTGIFNDAKREKTQKVYEFIQGLAKKAGFIFNSTDEGNLRLDRANVDGEPILCLLQGEAPIIGGIKANYNGTERYSEFIATGQSRGRPGNEGVIRDETVKVKRPYIFDAKNTTAGNITDAAKWERARSLARSAQVTLTLSGWNDKYNRTITENQIITLWAPNVHIYYDTRFLIEKVVLKQEAGGKLADLTLVLPQAYTLEWPENMPWDR
jgi:prophage tail gpP-like protein